MREEASHLCPDGTLWDVAESLSATLDRLYPWPDDEVDVYRATRHVVWQTMAVMVAKDVTPSCAAQMLVAALMELLAEGLGPAGAAQHLRRMADELDAIRLS